MREGVAFFTADCTGLFPVTIKFWRRCGPEKTGGDLLWSVQGFVTGHRMPQAVPFLGQVGPLTTWKPTTTPRSRQKRRGRWKGHPGDYIGYADLPRVSGEESRGVSRPVSHPALCRPGTTHPVEADTEATSSARGRSQAATSLVALPPARFSRPGLRACRRPGRRRAAPGSCRRA